MTNNYLFTAVALTATVSGHKISKKSRILFTARV